MNSIGRYLQISLLTSLGKVINFLPSLITAVIVLIVGWIIAAILARVTNKLLEKAHFDELVQRGKVKETLNLHSTQFDPSNIVGAIVFWAILVSTFLLTANILGLTAISILLTRLISFLPFVVVAVVAIVVAVALAEIAHEAIVALLGDRIEGVQAIATAAKWGIITFGIFVALSQLQVAPTIVNGLFLAIIGGISIAFAISFGLGNVELAKKITSDWYDHSWQHRQDQHEAKKRKLPPAA